MKLKSKERILDPQSAVITDPHMPHMCHFAMNKNKRHYYMAKQKH